eukprot:TRINITY_DN14464_c0_g1_i1.p1 TRINITY_DN14464_c0_g1~~TRINITY_DN14464_c0_g1_i1.p1  ORF type:complete len:258 (-),score=27.34 TRINITY_DN14464_c0_g1_i1:144-917(-)
MEKTENDWTISDSEMEHAASLAELPEPDSEWELVYMSDVLLLWRRPKGDGWYTWQARSKMIGVPVHVWFKIDQDFESRVVWDEHMMMAKPVLQHDNGTTLMHWKVKFPWPMYPRDYCQARRSEWMGDRYAIVGRSLPHKAIPEDPKVAVRVLNQSAYLAMRACEGGSECTLMYEDDPRCVLPKSIINWITSIAVPKFHAKMTEVCRKKMAEDPTLLELTPEQCCPSRIHRDAAPSATAENASADTAAEAGDKSERAI